MTPSPSDAESVAASIVGDPDGGASASPSVKRVGRPPLSEEERARRAERRAQESRERARKFREERRAEKTAHVGPTPEEIEEAKAFAFLWSTLWQIGGSRLSLRALTDEEADTIGRASVPVARKYLGNLGKWAPEANLALVLVGLYVHTRIEEKKESSNGSGEGVEEK